MSKSGVIVVFAKQPQPGAVKTRMCPPLRPDEAAELYEAMLDDVLATTAVAARAAGAAAWLQVHPPDAAASLAARSPGFQVGAQQGSDLGARMADAVAAAAAAGFERILLRGSDNPALPAAELLRGLETLDEADLAVGPDCDGGYGWIALRRPLPGLFDHPMSTASVLEDTLANAAAGGLRVRALDRHFDLDTVEDLVLLAEARRAGRAGACPRTLALLDARGWWRHVPGS